MKVKFFKNFLKGTLEFKITNSNRVIIVYYEDNKENGCIIASSYEENKHAIEQQVNIFNKRIKQAYKLFDALEHKLFEDSSLSNENKNEINNLLLSIINRDITVFNAKNEMMISIIRRNLLPYELAIIDVSDILGKQYENSVFDIAFGHEWIFRFWVGCQFFYPVINTVSLISKVNELKLLINKI